MEQNQTGVGAANEAIVEQGNKVLIDALGHTGAVEYLRLIQDKHRPVEVEKGAADETNLKTLMVNIGIDRKRKEVVLTFSRQTNWLRFSFKEAMDFAKVIASRASALGQMLSS